MSVKLGAELFIVVMGHMVAGPKLVVGAVMRRLVMQRVRLMMRFVIGVVMGMGHGVFGVLEI